MIDVRIKLALNDGTIDSKVSAMTKLVSIPNKGECIFLDDEVKEELMSKIKSSVEVANIYANYWSTSDKITNQRELEDAFFYINRAIFVNVVLYKTNSPLVCIEMDHLPEKYKMRL